MKRKILGMLLSAAVIGGILTGCGNKEKSVREETDHPVELDFYMMVSSPVQDAKRIMRKANEIIEEKIGAHMNLIMVDHAIYAEKMNLMIHSGAPWDLCFTAGWEALTFMRMHRRVHMRI